MLAGSTETGGKYLFSTNVLSHFSSIFILDN